MHQKSLHRFWRHGRTDQWNLVGISGDMAPNKTRFQSFTVIVQIFFWTNYYSSEVFFELSYSKICDHSPSNCHLFQVMAAQWSHWSPEFVVGLRPIEKDDEDNMVIFHFANTKQPLRWGATFWDIFPLGDLLDFFHHFSALSIRGMIFLSTIETVTIESPTLSSPRRWLEAVCFTFAEPLVGTFDGALVRGGAHGDPNVDAEHSSSSRTLNWM